MRFFNLSKYFLTICLIFLFSELCEAQAQQFPHITKSNFCEFNVEENLTGMSLLDFLLIRRIQYLDPSDITKLRELVEVCKTLGPTDEYPDVYILKRPVPISMDLRISLPPAGYLTKDTRELWIRCSIDTKPRLLDFSGDSQIPIDRFCNPHSAL